MKRILAFGASNSNSSINHKFATYTVNRLKGVDADIIEMDDYEMPIFGVDKQKESGIPDEAHKFLEKIRAADGIIISFAEHNGAYTAAFKNLFDWTSRIDGDMWHEVPMLALATSPGKRGAISVLSMALDRFRFMGGNVVAHFSLPSFKENFDQQNGILDEKLRAAYEGELQKFAEYLELELTSARVSSSD